MSDAKRWERGREMLRRVYAGAVEPPPRGALPLTDVMLEQLFAEVWTREDVMPIRDRRLLLLGVIAAQGEPMTFGVQARAALARGELTPVQLREVLLQLAQYAGYPRVAALIGVVEEAIAEFEKDGGAKGAAPTPKPKPAAAD